MQDDDVDEQEDDVDDEHIHDVDEQGDDDDDVDEHVHDVYEQDADIFVDEQDDDVDEQVVCNDVIYEHDQQVCDDDPVLYRSVEQMVEVFERETEKSDASDFVECLVFSRSVSGLDADPDPFFFSLNVIPIILGKNTLLIELAIRFDENEMNEK